MSVPVLPRYSRATAIQFAPLADTGELDPFAPNGSWCLVSPGVWYVKLGGTWALASAASFGKLAVSTKTGTFTAVDSVDAYFCTTSSAGYTVNLPTAVGIAGKQYVIKKAESNATRSITIDAAGTETIDGALTYVLAGAYESVTLVSDGANWQVV